MFVPYLLYFSPLQCLIFRLLTSRLSNIKILGLIILPVLLLFIVCCIRCSCTYYVSCLLIPLILHSLLFYLRMCIYCMRFIFFFSLFLNDMNISSVSFSMCSYSMNTLLWYGWPIIGFYEVFTKFGCSCVFRF